MANEHVRSQCPVKSKVEGLHAEYIYIGRTRDLFIQNLNVNTVKLQRLMGHAFPKSEELGVVVEIHV